MYGYHVTYKYVSSAQNQLTNTQTLELENMEIVHTERNRGKQAIIVDGYGYRHVNTLKNGDVVYVCRINKKCNKSITTDPKGIAVVKTKNEYSCGKEPDPR